MSKTTRSIRIDNEVLRAASIQADKENRSVNNMIEVLIQRALEVATNDGMDKAAQVNK